MEKKLLKGNTSYFKVFINEDLTTLRFKLFHYIKSMDSVKSVYNPQWEDALSNGKWQEGNRRQP
jgi:hypothetical protein